MKNINDLTIEKNQKTRVAFGFFDGFHIGHKKIIEQLCSKTDYLNIVLSFYDETIPFISSEREKEWLIREYPVSEFVSIDYNTVSHMSIESFTKEILVDKFNVKEVVIGELGIKNTCFSNIENLRNTLKKYSIEVETVVMVRTGDEIVSRDLILDSIGNSDFDKVKATTERPFLMIGKVVHGKAAGRKFGMPTANLDFHKNKILPPHGVYGALCIIDGEINVGMTNVGLRPSDDDIPTPSVETFILNFSKDIYDREIVIELHKYVRGVKKFEGGLSELRKQIDKDIEQVKEYMEEVTKNYK